MTSDARQIHGNLRYAMTNNVIWANQKTESFECHWLRALAMFDVTSFPAILSGIRRHFKQTVNTLFKWAASDLRRRYRALYLEGLVQNYCNYLILYKKLQ